jgi:hypothetical protein
MILASFNPNGDLKHVAEFLRKAFLVLGISFVLLLVALGVWVFFLVRTGRQKENRAKRRCEISMKCVMELAASPKINWHSTFVRAPTARRR